MINLNPFDQEIVTFETPLEMLTACHDKVRHFAALLTKLVNHVGEHGIDVAAEATASSILRYFDVAAPLHHQDEDEDLYPLLLVRGNDELSVHILALMQEHDELGALWQEVRAGLLAMVAGDAGSLAPALAREFSQRYAEHARREEVQVFPFAEQLIAATELAALGERMAARRRG